MTVDLEVIKKAYGWSIGDDGELHGLTAGDMGYEPTGIIIPMADLISFCDDNQSVKQEDLPGYKAGYQAAMHEIKDHLMKRILEGS